MLLVLADEVNLAAGESQLRLVRMCNELIKLD